MSRFFRGRILYDGSVFENFVGPNATVFVGLRYLLRDAVVFTATVTQADGSTVDAHTATFEDVLNEELIVKTEGFPPVVVIFF